MHNVNLAQAAVEKNDIAEAVELNLKAEASNKHEILLPKWFDPVPLQNSILAGEGLRWQHNAR